MIISNKEKALLAITVIVMLYAVIGISFQKKFDGYKEQKRIQAEKVQLINSYQSLIDQKAHWQTKYESHSSKLPTFSHNKQVETHWSSLLYRIANKNKLIIIGQQAREETSVGDVFEWPIECKWESNLESLVSFLYDIHAEGAMLDIRKLSIRANKGKSLPLSGSFTIYCAYMRDDSNSQKEPSK